MQKLLTGLFFVFGVILSLGVFPSTTSAQSTYNCANQSVITFAECQALVDLYVSTAGDNRVNNTNRLETENPCKWYGISCAPNLSTVTAQSHVNGIVLNTNNLVGELPASFGQLVWLKKVMLSNNLMCGLLPETLVNLVNLVYANFSYNDFLTSGYSTQMLAFLNQSFVTWLPQNNPQSCGQVELPTVEILVNNNDEETESAKFVLGGDSINETPFVAGYVIYTDDGDAIIRDLSLLVSGPGTSQFSDGADEAIIYAEDQVTVIDSQYVTNDTSVDFDNIDFSIPEGQHEIYVKVIGDLIGEAYEGEQTDELFLSLVATDVEDVVSGMDVAPTYDGTNQTLPSKNFRIVPVKFSDANFALTAAGFMVDTSISDGADQSIAIFKLTADTRQNTDVNNGSSVKINMSQLIFGSTNTTDITNYEIRRIGNGSTTYLPCSVVGDIVTCNISGGNVATREIPSSVIGYYLIRADIDAGGNNTTVRLSVDNMNEGTPVPVNYAPTDASASYDSYRIGRNYDYIESPTVAIIN